MKNKDLLSIMDLSPAEFGDLLDRAAEIKRQPRHFAHALEGRTLLMIFEAPSLRTRLSFETAMTQMHGHAINYEAARSPWGLGKESVEDVARVVSRYCDAVTARIFSHEDLATLAEWASVPVINAMTNRGHPCQILSDFLTIREKLGRVEGLRLAYCGDANNNVTYSLMEAAVLTGNHLAVGCPPHADFRPDPAVAAQIATLAERGSGSFDVHDDPAAAMRGAHVVYADSWMSYRVPADQKEARLAALRPYRIDGKLFAEADRGALFMHCLPAQRGQEVTAEVIDGAHSVVFDQAENRLHVEKAILVDLVGGAPAADRPA